jgi:metallophosphoesterase (TIGR00282 family)
MKVLFIGDIVGNPGRTALKAVLPMITGKYKIDFIIANGENAAGGFGITEAIASELFSVGINVLTSGNHIWDKKEAMPYISKEERLLRPLNYPPGVPGYGSIALSVPNGSKIAVINLSGRVFMSNMDCPFRVGKEEIERLRGITKNIVIDFHAEATSEKLAFAHFVDGTVSAVIGTHTHVQTADETILPKGTAYITDVGMTGPLNSIIGVETEQVIERFLLQLPKRFDAAKGRAVLSAVALEIKDDTGMASAIQRLQITNP